MRMHSNIAVFPNRLLAKQWDGSGAFAPTTGTKTFDVTAPTKREQAMGMAGKNGVVSFIALDGGNQAYTLWVWVEAMAKLNSGNGWIKNGANPAEYTKTCDQLSLISFTIYEDAEFFIQIATTAVTSALVSGEKSGKNDNTLLTGNTQ